MRLKRGNFWGSPPPVGNFASMCTSAVDLSMANWLNAGRKSTSKTSSASLPAPSQTILGHCQSCHYRFDRVPATHHLSQRLSKKLGIKRLSLLGRTAHPQLHP